MTVPFGNQSSYDAFFRAKVHEALADTRQPVPHKNVMDEAQALIDRKRGHSPVGADGAKAG